MAAADRSDGTPSSRPAPPCHKSDDTTVNDGSPLELALDCLPALPALLFGLFLACSLVLTPRRQVHEHDRPRGDLAFVVFTYADLAALFWCARRVERLAAAAAASRSPGPVRERDERRRRLQVAVWVLSTALSCAFAYRVSLIMPPALVLVVWAMASSVVLVGFYVLVLCEDQGYYRLLESAGDGEDGGLGEKKSGAGGGELV